MIEALYTIGYERADLATFVATLKEANVDVLLEEREEVVANLAHELEGRVALMCYERDHRICHRQMAADRLAFLTGLESMHLEPDIPASTWETHGLYAAQSASRARG